MTSSTAANGATSSTAANGATSSNGAVGDPPLPGEVVVRLRVNGRDRRAVVEPRKTLADTLREDLRLTGTHLGCEHGVCGACTVHLDGRAVRSCLMFAVQAEGCEITTIEGLADTVPGDGLHPVQQGFTDEHGLQCGFCTPGFVMSAAAFLARHPDPSDEELRVGLSGNLCRCTGYQGILRAVRRAAEQLRAPGQPRDAGGSPAGAQPRTGAVAS